MSKAFSLVRKRFVHGLGFAPWVKPCFGRTDGYVDSTIFGGSHFRDGHLPPGTHSTLTRGWERRDPTRQLKPGTVAPRCGEDF